MRNAQLRQSGGPRQVDVEHAVPDGEIRVGDTDILAEQQDAGRVDEVIDAAKTRFRGLDGALEKRVVGDVALEIGRPRTEVFVVVGCRLEIDHANRSARSAKILCHPRPHAAAGTGNDRGLAAEIPHDRRNLSSVNAATSFAENAEIDK